MEPFMKPPLEMNFSTTEQLSLSERWRRWKETMQLYLGLNMSKASEKEQCAAFRYVIGQDGRDIYNTMKFTEAQTDKIDVLFAKFDEYCEPRRNTIIERYKFNTRVQRDDETADQERLLRERELTLDKAFIEVCQINEQSEEQLKVLNDVQSVKAIGKHNKSGNYRSKLDANRKRHFKHNGGNKQEQVSCCGKCGKSHPAKECPAFGKKCFKCDKKNHFVKFCKSKKIHAVDKASTDDEPLFIGAVNSIHNEENVFKTLSIEGNEIKFKIDTGTQANIIPLPTFEKMKLKQTRLERPTAKLTSYTGDYLPVVGECNLKCNNKTLKFFVVKTGQVPIIGLKASQELNLIKIIMNVNNVIGQSAETIHEIFPKSFKKYTSCAQREAEVFARRYGKKGVVEKVDGPTEWVNSTVIIEKPNSDKLRICLDPRPLNEAIKREHFKMPTIEEITTRVAGARVFSKLDANHGYWQILLDEESRLLTTFNTPFGRYCYKRMPFGITSAQEVFQKRMCQSFGDLEGVETDVDDILVWGATVEEHDERLMNTLQRCEEINLTLNKEKCEFRVKEVTYIGHKLTREGVKPDEQKVKAIKQMPPPEDKKGVERLLGTVNYLAKFIPNMSTIMQPIREVMKSGVEFHWGGAQEKAFQEVKELLTKAPVLAYYDVKKPVTVTCDASKSGVGSSIEKELLAVVFAFEKFNQYTYARAVKVETDHNPLLSIVKKSLTSAPPRLQRMLLRLQRYDFTLKYRPGKEMIIADTLSRAYLTDDDVDSSKMNEELECYVHTVTSRMPVSEERLEQIKKETAIDQTMKTLFSTIRREWPETR
ncbi:Hypothetical predicted protein [Paramuricea clavata]|uniref:RNA-directed DNA polymerase n=1 Tax=Paramuricea clavata TaxID=317549 RepID=A0A6S7H7I2_PARCT|nr:Hypothetical predicted protein [Paramuricea clavata]